MQQQSSKVNEQTIPKQSETTQTIPKNNDSNKKSSGAIGKTILGAVVGLPIGLLVGMKYFIFIFY